MRTITGPKIFTNASVKYVERRDHRWLVYDEALDSKRQTFDGALLLVSADIVVHTELDRNPGTSA